MDILESGTPKPKRPSIRESVMGAWGQVTAPTKVKPPMPAPLPDAETNGPEILWEMMQRGSRRELGLPTERIIPSEEHEAFRKQVGAGEAMAIGAGKAITNIPAQLNRGRMSLDLLASALMGNTDRQARVSKDLAQAQAAQLERERLFKPLAHAYPGAGAVGDIDAASLMGLLAPAKGGRTR